MPRRAFSEHVLLDNGAASGVRSADMLPLHTSCVPHSVQETTLPTQRVTRVSCCRRRLRASLPAAQRDADATSAAAVCIAALRRIASLAATSAKRNTHLLQAESELESAQAGADSLQASQDTVARELERLSAEQTRLQADLDNLARAGAGSTARLAAARGARAEGEARVRRAQLQVTERQEQRGHQSQLDRVIKGLQSGSAAGPFLRLLCCCHFRTTWQEHQHTIMVHSSGHASHMQRCVQLLYPVRRSAAAGVTQDAVLQVALSYSAGTNLDMQLQGKVHTALHVRSRCQVCLPNLTDSCVVGSSFPLKR